MPDKGPRIYWDANVFLSYIDQVEDRMPVLDALLAESDQGALTIITSVMSLVEVAFAAQEQLKRVLSATEEERIEALWQDRRVVEVVEFHEGIARDARGLIRDSLVRRWKLKPKDAEHLASARYHGASAMQTYDRKLWRYSTMLGIPVSLPDVLSPRLLDA